MFDDGARRWRANGAADCGANIYANFNKRHWVKRILTRNATGNRGTLDFAVNP